jgi:hypothetical protein
MTELSQKEFLKSLGITNVPNPLSDLEIPDTWNDVEEFARWWIEARTPFLFPERPEVFLSDDATSVPVFRKGRFQIELYLIHPQPLVNGHEHPGVEVIKVRMGFGDFLSITKPLKDGESHGAGFRLEMETTGYPLIAIQHWKNREPCTIAAMWKGATVGPMHEELIKRFNPDAYIVDGYADITRKMTDV